jgi:hypothetical protein
MKAKLSASFGNLDRTFLAFSFQTSQPQALKMAKLPCECGKTYLKSAQFRRQLAHQPGLDPALY